jgi:parvulin-like peptidyl-prolyl isomerase
MRFTVSLALLTCTCNADIIDRVAITVGRTAILDSEIRREVRVTAFLNQEPVNLSEKSRKIAASRLIDQALIREQIRTGAYPVASQSEAANFLSEIKKDRFRTDGAYKRALAQYGISETELKERLLWQLTVLRFIDARFRPAVVVSDQDAQKYYEQHRQAYPQGFEASRQAIIEQIAGERMNDLLDDWLEQSRKQARIEYLEKSLQ